MADDKRVEGEQSGERDGMISGTVVGLEIWGGWVVFSERGVGRREERRGEEKRRRGEEERRREEQRGEERSREAQGGVAERGEKREED